MQVKSGTVQLWVGVIFFILVTGCQNRFTIVPDHQGKTIHWSGYRWYVKEASHVQGPGANKFSSADDVVWVDNNGNLHLSITYRDGQWVCSEIISEEPLGYGNYSIAVSTPVDNINSHAVLGFFTWKPVSLRHHNEIDIELSRWGRSEGHNGQYVVQPFYFSGHRHQFHFEQTGDYSTHEFTWLPYAVKFRSYPGHYAPDTPPREFASWVFSGFRTPGTRKTHVRINLWLNHPTGPKNGEAVEVVIKEFRFTPLSEL